MTFRTAQEVHPGQTKSGRADVAAPEPVADAVARHASAAAGLPRAAVGPIAGAHPHQRARITAVRSTPCCALLAATATADLVVIAAHRRRPRPGPQLGPVTAALLHHARCPVAIVPVQEARER
jgi:nucleotide-binding universal stress UspA family protein